MAQNAENVDVLTTGYLAVAALGTVLPVNAATALVVAWKDLGWLNEDGITETPSADVNEIKAIDGSVLKKPQTKHDITYELTLLETNNDTVLLFYGNGTAAEWAINADPLPHQSFVIDTIEGADVVKRMCIPDGQITDRKAITHKLGEPIAYGVTITCYPDVDGEKVYVYRTADLIS